MCPSKRVANGISEFFEVGRVVPSTLSLDSEATPTVNMFHAYLGPIASRLTGFRPGGRWFKSNRQVQAIPRSRIGLHSNCEVLCNTWNLSNLSNRLSNDLTNGQGIRLFKVNDHQAALARASCCSLPLEGLQHAPESRQRTIGSAWNCKHGSASESRLESCPT